VTAGAIPVVRAAAAPIPLGPGVTAATLLDDSDGCDGLRQRLLTWTAGGSLTGGSLTGTAGGFGEAWYVAAGHGRLRGAAELRAGTAVWLPRGSRYEGEAIGDNGLRVLAVTVCAGSPADDAGMALRVVTLDSCEPERTGDREFRVLLSAGLAITQFVGLIPPGRAPEHHHTYDEVVHVLAGHGVVHLATGDAPITPGTSVYLPPYQPHCLENTGEELLQVLGVFYPAGSPAAKASE
jgi:mannose-6-phosphate isomerase-like protein (cupin superfamily)